MIARREGQARLSSFRSERVAPRLVSHEVQYAMTMRGISGRRLPATAKPRCPSRQGVLLPLASSPRDLRS